MNNLFNIESIEDKRLDIFFRLTGAQMRNKLEPDKGIFIAESPMVIDVALKSGIKPIALLTESKLINSDVADIIMRCKDVPIYVAKRELLKQITGFELTRGALCAMQRPHLPTAGELLSGAKRAAVLEGVCDSTNIGSIFRSAAALGIDCVLLSPTACDPLTRRAIRVSMGTVLQVKWARLTESKEEWERSGIQTLKNAGFKCCAMALRGDTVPICDEKIKETDKLAIILGTEGDGLNTSTIDKCDFTVKIPMFNNVDSLNVACAASIAFWEMCKK